MKRAALVLCLAMACASAQVQTAPRATIRVGLWTLWHDHDATISPISGATLRLCESCAARPLTAMTLRVNKDKLSWTYSQGKPLSSVQLLIAGSYRITAHGEALTLTYPLRITVQSGALVLAATLPVERYVELVVAAESGTADSTESRKALAVVVRSFALAPTHGHTAFDVCDSTHWLMRLCWPQPTKACGATEAALR